MSLFRKIFPKNIILKSGEQIDPVKLTEYVKELHKEDTKEAQTAPTASQTDPQAATQTAPQTEEQPVKKAPPKGPASGGSEGVAEVCGREPVSGNSHGILSHKPLPKRKGLCGDRKT